MLLFVQYFERFRVKDLFSVKRIPRDARSFYTQNKQTNRDCVNITQCVVMGFYPKPMAILLFGDETSV